jgi:hypothetical protein
MMVEPEYVPGQVWNYKTRTDEADSTLTILKIESYPALTTIHIRIDNVRITDCQGDQVSHTISHAPITKDALDQSVTQLVRQEPQIPGFEEEYQDWISDQGGTFIMPVAEVVAILEDTCRYGNKVT